MKFLLSFAIGAILGDIFFHLIPESLQSLVNELNYSHEIALKKVGVSIIAGIFMFIIVEMVLEEWSKSIKNDKSARLMKEVEKLGEEHEQHIIDHLIPIFNNKDLSPTFAPLVEYDEMKDITDNNNGLVADLNAFNLNNNNNEGNLTTKAHYLVNDISSLLAEQQLKNRKKVPCEKKLSNIQNLIPKAATIQAGTAINLNGKLKEQPKVQDCKIIEIAGYLSLIANGFDNFTHGLAIGASFLVGSKVGILTTFVIFIHEIPHEICDYAILVNSGFSRWDAVKAQSSVSLFGLLGTAIALYVKSVQTFNSYTVWILPFSAGGFLYIVLVNLLPDILDRKTNFYNSIGQIVCVILGTAFMAIVAII